MKKTKIVATISDFKCEVEFIKELYESGMNVARLNTAHQEVDSITEVIKNIRKVSEDIAILIDTKGPEIRTSSQGESYDVKEGDKIKVIGDPDENLQEGLLPINYLHFCNEINIGNKILIDDGELELIAIEKHENHLICEVGNDGTIKKKKSINVPGVSISLPAISKRDLTFIKLAADQNVDFVAHSFVRSKKDVEEVKKILKANNSHVKIISKIENQEGFDNIDEIIEASYGIMVARGDLAIELPYEVIPRVQKTIITKCIEKRKPVIIATQMLHSMIDNPRPTRAEVSDIANAVLSQADALMLSGETAYGKYPIDAVKTMAKVAEETERWKKPMNNIEKVILSTDISAWLTKNAVRASLKLEAKAIIADTISGKTVLNIAGYRGIKPVYAMCYSQKVVRQLALSYGIFPIFMEPRNSFADFFKGVFKKMLNKNLINENDKVVIVAGNFGIKNGATFIEISTPEEILSIAENKTNFS
jgi:pyruvate kinase